MASFGKRSKEERNTLHPKLQRIVDEAIKHEDFSIIQGIRYIEEQEELLRAGKTKTLKSKHLPDKNGKSRAMDIVPYPIEDHTMNNPFVGKMYIPLIDQSLLVMISYSLVCGILSVFILRRREAT